MVIRKVPKGYKIVMGVGDESIIMFLSYIQVFILFNIFEFNIFEALE